MKEDMGHDKENCPFAGTIESLGHTLSALGVALDKIDNKIDNIHAQMFASQDPPSHNIRIDRLEQAAGRRDKWVQQVLYPLIAALAIACATALWRTADSNPESKEALRTIAAEAAREAVKAK
jgi:hypothetical protein